jgi:hypothetical protein
LLLLFLKLKGENINKKQMFYWSCLYKNSTANLYQGCQLSPVGLK